MAQFPYLYATGFEAGAVDTGGVLTDTDAKSGYQHYTASVASYSITPFRGAYSWIIDQDIGTATTDCIQTVAGFDVADANYWSIGFAFYAKSTTMANGNRTSIMKAVSAGPVDEFVLQLYYTTAGGLQLLLTEAYDTAVGSNPVVPLTENTWHWIELYGMKDNAANNNGTAYLVLDGEAIGSISSLNQADFTDAIFGVDDADAGHTAGIYAFDDVLMSGIQTTSQVRIGYRNRYPMNPHISAISTSTYTEHLFVGRGTVRRMTLLTNNSGDIVRLYDTDTGYTTGSYAGNLVAEANEAADMTIAEGPFLFERGCFVSITAAGANGARGIVEIEPNPDIGYPAAVYYGNDGLLKSYAMSTRTRRPGNM
uniref:Uncharacterized protein n=1 Tax=viral metagenome TaxID=1070528 RepID=A0A6M3JWD3_9ZZZZ